MIRFEDSYLWYGYLKECVETYFGQGIDIYPI